MTTVRAGIVCIPTRELVSRIAHCCMVNIYGRIEVYVAVTLQYAACVCSIYACDMYVRENYSSIPTDAYLVTLFGRYRKSANLIPVSHSSIESIADDYFPPSSTNAIND